MRCGGPPNLASRSRPILPNVLKLLALSECVVSSVHVSVGQDVLKMYQALADDLPCLQQCCLGAVFSLRDFAARLAQSMWQEPELLTMMSSMREEVNVSPLRSCTRLSGYLLILEGFSSTFSSFSYVVLIATPFAPMRRDPPISRFIHYLSSLEA